MEYVGKYRIIRTLGQGGMGVVYEALDEKIRSRVAVKVLNRKFVYDPEVMTRFMNEAHIANSISHPGIVKVFDHGFLPTGEAYFVMEYLDGKPLRSRTISACKNEDIIRWGKQMASVLAAAHEIGIVHRDLKPDNLMLIVDPDVEGGERIRVLDFGIARICMPEHLGEELDLLHMTKTGMLIGTPMYMAPEQCSSAKTVDGKADVYAIGVILYELACGQPPFIGQPQEASKPSNPGAAAVAILFSHLNHEPPPLHEKNPQLSPALASLIHRLLAKNPADRPSMRELLAELQRLSAQNTQAKTSKEATHSRPTPEDGLESRPMLATARWRWNSAGVALVALGVVSIALYMRAERHRVDVSNTTSSTSPRSLPTIEAQPSDSQVSERQKSILVQPSAGDRIFLNSHRQNQRTSARPGKNAKVNESSVDVPPSEDKIKLILSEAREHASHGQFSIALEMTLPIVSAKYQLPAESARLVWRQHGISACNAGDLREARSAYTHLSNEIDRNSVIYICSRKKLLCQHGDVSEFCASLKSHDASTQSASVPPKELRNPF